FFGAQAWALPPACERGLTDGAYVPLTLRNVVAELARKAPPDGGSKLSISHDGGTTELNAEGHPFDEPYNLSVTAKASGDPYAHTFFLGEKTEVTREDSITTAVSETRFSTGKRMGLWAMLWDGMAHEPGDPRQWVPRDGSDYFTERTEIRFSVRGGQVVYFEGWIRRIYRFHSETVEHVRLR
ncbi:MAG: hypothetical protein HY075_11630, partial [Deltaproteobacteria bacterium]|nr:hypothetical protein [Deltaproteobacteria bacterium]